MNMIKISKRPSAGSLMGPLNRRSFVVAAAGVTAALGLPAFARADDPAPAAPAPTGIDEAGIDLGKAAAPRVLGKADAKVTIIEYASLTCPHCADFAVHILPDVKKEFIDTGRARLEYRDYPLDGLALRAAMMARLTEGERYFQLIEMLFSTQGQWARAKDPLSALSNIGKLAGIDAKLIDKALSDEKLSDIVLQSRMDGEKTWGVDATPTFFVGTRKISGAQPIEEFRKAIEAEGA